jgi:16S rRNA (guanine527-N7)-methyltransferase
MTSPLVLNPAELIDRYLERSRLDLYYELLMEQNRLVNLVSRETSREGFDRMVAESLLPLDALNRSFDSYLDIGSGGGLPSIPLLLAGVGSRTSVLVERTGKKARALGQIVEKLGLPSVVESRNFAEISPTKRYALITLRYVKLDRSLLAKIMAGLGSKGRFVYYSTPEFRTDGWPSRTVRFESGQDQAVKSFTIFHK